MEQLESLWERIDRALEAEDSAQIEQIHKESFLAAFDHSANREDFFYASGYVAYMHPKGRRDTAMRKSAELAFLQALLYCPGFLPALLYLAFIKMDNNDYTGALSLLFSCVINEKEYDTVLIDRFVEAKVCCLIECGYWEVALRELDWFKMRIDQDTTVGIDLINFMKIIEDKTAENDLEAKVIELIHNVLTIRA